MKHIPTLSEIGLRRCHLLKEGRASRKAHLHSGAYERAPRMELLGTFHPYHPLTYARAGHAKKSMVRLNSLFMNLANFGFGFMIIKPAEN